MEYPETHWDLVNQMADIIEDARKDETITKAELLEELNPIVMNMIQKMVATPMASSYCLFRKKT